MFLFTTDIMALFSMPLDVPTKALSLLWVIPIGLTMSLVCKAVKMDEIKPGPFLREVMLLFLTGIGMLVFTGLVLLGIVQLAGLLG